MWYHVMCLEDSRLWTVWSFILKSSPDLFQCTLCRLVVHRWPLKGAATHQIIAPVYFRLCILTVHQPTHQANIQILLHYYEHDPKNYLSAPVSLFYWRTLKTFFKKTCLLKLDSIRSECIRASHSSLSAFESPLASFYQTRRMNVKNYLRQSKKRRFRFSSLNRSFQ